MAVVLAFLFRAFVAEAFVIPTGSMAPTLMGQHKDVVCPECHFRYQAGASIEIDDQSAPSAEGTVLIPRQGTVVGTTCPICRYRMKLDWADDSNQETFVGDRILVSKFLYDFSDPHRWDVIVFKFPFNAKENYRKRLEGLPNETLRIRHGDIYVKTNGDESFEIVRKPDAKLLAMMQLVDDTDHLATDLRKVGWPLRWQPWASGGVDATAQWETLDDGHTHQTKGLADQDIWLRYHHFVPDQDDWQVVRQGTLPDDISTRQGKLITDFYGYNAFTWLEAYAMPQGPPNPKTSIEEQYGNVHYGRGALSPEGTYGLNWVGDLVVEGDVQVQGDGGELLLQLVKGGVRNVCRIDVKTGDVKLSRNDGRQPFHSAGSENVYSVEGKSDLQGPGTYDVRFSNVDAELRLWIDGDRVTFAAPTTYEPPESSRPHWSAAEPGDLAPVGIGSRGLAMKVERLKIYRDVYYVATYGTPAHEYRLPYSAREIRAILNDPERWSTTSLFEKRNTLTETLGPNQFFPMGDNSPQSSDARLWPEHYFARNLLIGKALFIYWPHPWHSPIPYFPNFGRMRLIR